MITDPPQPWEKNIPKAARDMNILADYFLHPMKGGHWRKSINYMGANNCSGIL
jgi:hypothetical protein